MTFSSGPESNNPDDRSSLDGRKRSHRFDDDLAALFLGSPGAGTISQLQRSYRELSNREGRSESLSPDEKHKVQDLEDRFRTSVADDLREGRVFGDTSITQVLVFDEGVVRKPQSGIGPIYGFAAEVRNNDGMNFLLTAAGVHEVRGTAYHRITSHPDELFEFKYEILMSRECFELERKALEEAFDAGRFLTGDADMLYLGALIADEVAYATDRDGFELTDVLAVELPGGDSQAGFQYLLYLTDGSELGVSLRHFRRSNVPVVEVATLSE